MYKFRTMYYNSDDSIHRHVVSQVMQGQPVSFEEKGGKATIGWINAGIYLLNRELLITIPSGIQCSLEHDFFPKIIEKGLHAYRCNGKFLDIGTPKSYAQAGSFFSKT